MAMTKAVSNPIAIMKPRHLQILTISRTTTETPLRFQTVMAVVMIRNMKVRYVEIMKRFLKGRPERVVSRNVKS